MPVRFGPAGLPDLGGIDEGLRALSGMGFDACEFDFVKEFWLDKASASGAKDVVEELGLAVRAHAPFYGVLSQDQPKKQVMAVAMMHHAANLVHLIGGDGITVHPGFYMGRSRQGVMDAVLKRCRELEDRLTDNGIDDIIIGVENMGNGREFGGQLEDILDICECSPILSPMIDWGHLQATCDGCLQGAGDYIAVLAVIEDRLGREGLERTRHQFSEVEFSNGVERRHVGYGEGGMRLEFLLDALEDMNLGEAIVISECPAMEDHLKMLEVVKGRRGSVTPVG
jgi:deoxyribonuclease-4